MTTYTKTKNNSVTGGGSDDIIVVGSADAYLGGSIDGGGGTDELRFATLSAEILSLSNAPISSVEKIVIGTGTGASADTTGTAAASIDAGLVGYAVTLTGNNGNNRLKSGSQNDTLNGGGGNDELTGGDGDDLLEGGGGNDFLDGGNGADTASYATAPSGAGGVGVTVGLGIQGLAQNTVTAGSDTLISIENLVGSAYADTLTGNNGGNLLDGGGGNDTLTGGNGADSLQGGGNDDVFIINNASEYTGDTIDGGSGADELRFAATANGAVLTLEASISNVESLTVSAGSVTAGINAAAVPYGVAITGNSGGNALTGGGFDDTLTGGGGADNLVGGNGNDLFLVGTAADFTGDTVNGGAGSDELRFTTTTNGSVLALSASISNVESFVIGTGTGSVAVTTGTATASIDGSALAYGASFVGNEGGNTLKGGALNDTLSGGGGNDSLVGGNGDDVLVGGSGSDNLSGGIGNDIFLVNSAADYASDLVDGGTGIDELRYAATTDGAALALNALLSGVESAVIGTGTGASADTSGTAAVSLDASLLNYGIALTGNSGANTLRGTALGDTLSGGGGNDILIGGAGADSLSGGAGNDLFMVYNASDYTGDTLVGDSGDEFRFATTSATTVVLNSAVSGIQSFVIGTGTGASADTSGTVGAGIDGSALAISVTVTGNAGANALSGGSGQDILYGGDGDDTLSGGGDLDVLNGETGNDVLRGGDGVDLLNGGGGNDLIEGEGGNDSKLDGEAGNDTIRGGEGNDSLTGGVGLDELAGEAGNDTLNGGDDDDSLDGGTDNDLLLGDKGNDRLDGGAGIDTASYTDFTANLTLSLDLPGVPQDTGGAGLDTLTNIENLIGGKGVDTLIGNSGDNVLDGGGLGDTASYATAAGGVTVSLAVSGPQNTGAGNDTLIHIQRLAGGAHNDRLTGDGQNNFLYGNGGDDSLYGGVGNDRVEGGANADLIEGGDGDDTLDGGDGDDTASYASATGGVTVSLAAQALFVQDTGGAGSDFLTGFENLIGGSGNDALTGDGGANRLEGGGGNDSIDGGGGNDTVSYASAPGGVTVSLAVQGSWQNTGGAGSDLLIGFENLLGGAGNDALTGDGGANRLEGGDGNDTLTGGGGADTLNSGDGSDLFLIDAATTYASASIDGGTGIDELRFAPATASTLTLGTASTAVESFVIGTGTGSVANPSGTLAAGLDASALAYGVALTGNAGANPLTGGAGNDTINGGGGDDLLSGGDGNDSLSGGLGADVAVFSGHAADYAFKVNGYGNITVTDLNPTDGDDGTDALSGIETARFADRDYGLALSGLGRETRVNTIATYNNQDNPAVASLPGGGFVVAWSSLEQDGSGYGGYGVYAQRYGADSAPAGGEFQVNTRTANDQSDATVAALPGGGFVVAWTSNQQDGSNDGVYAQRYGTDGAPAGGEFRVNTTTGSYQNEPSVAALPGGGFVVAWTSLNQDGSGYGVYAQRYGADGAPAGSEFRVNTRTANNQSDSTMAALPGGGFVVAWTSNQQDGSIDGVYARRYGTDGAPAGPEFRVNTATDFSQNEPSVAALPGGFVVAWTSYFQDGSSRGVYAQRYGGDGIPAGREFQVNTATQDEQFHPTVATLPGGGFVVAWTSNQQDGSGYGVYAQRYGADSAPAGGEFRVNTTTSGAQSQPTAAGMPDGGFVVAWTSLNQDGSGYGVYAQRYDADGRAVGGLTVTGTAGDDVLNLAGGGGVQVQAGAGSDTVAYSGHRADYTVTGNAGIVTVSGPNGTDTLTGVELLQFADGTESVPCFLRGTKILTHAGYVPVESLQAGDEVQTFAHGWRPVVWLGFRRVPRNPAGGFDHAVQPVRVHQGAFGPGMPRRDLWLSPDHAVFFRQHLIPAKALVNGDTVTREPEVDAITYYHVLLDRHAVVFSEGLPTESYCPEENLGGFENLADCPAAWRTDLAAPVGLLADCHPRVVTGPVVETARAFLARRAGVGFGPRCGAAVAG